MKQKIFYTFLDHIIQKNQLGKGLDKGLKGLKMFKKTFFIYQTFFSCGNMTFSCANQIDPYRPNQRLRRIQKHIRNHERKKIL